MSYVRQQCRMVINRISEDRRFIQAIVGPRQVGKTTLVNQVLENIKVPYTLHSADGILPTNAEWIGTVWEDVRLQMDFLKQPEHLLVIDEIQKIQNWSEMVKKEWDRDTRERRNIKVVILGSSRLLIMKGLTESLAGRFELIRMGHWSYGEMHDAFGWDLRQYIYFGGYPGCANMIDDETRWRTYVKDSLVESAISNDALMTATIYKPALLRQLFELGCGYSSELLSFNKMLGQLTDAGNVTTLSNYLHLLEECNLVCGLKKFAVDDSRKYNSIPKYQVFNPALHTVYAGRSMQLECTDARRWGRWVENAVGAHLVNNAGVYGYEVYYWREQDDEVDFVATKNGVVVAIEVKSGHRTTNRGLEVFRGRYKPHRAVVVGNGGIPVEDFLVADLSVLFS